MRSSLEAADSNRGPLFSAAMAASPVQAEARLGSALRARLDRAGLEAATLEFLRPRSRFRPDLRLIEWRGERAVAKDWGHASRWLRPHARGCLAREWRALTALAGVAGVPAVLDRLPDAIVVTHVPGPTLKPRHLRRGARAEFLARLDACVARIHARGVVHLDLRQRRNVLCAADGEPVVIDFESALVLDDATAFGRFALRWGRRVDRLALLKLKARFAPALLGPRERRYARLARALRWAWPSTPLHRARVALRRARRRGGS
jgi:predicted Ser/Thr protein kinase